MSTALNYIYLFYSKFIVFIFERMEFFPGVTFGWVVVSCIVFSVLIRSVFALPSKAQSHTFRKGDDDAG